MGKYATLTARGPIIQVVDVIKQVRAKCLLL
jgi:hypothetical protein